MLPYEKIEATIGEISNLPFDERRQAIRNVLVKAKSVGLMSNLQQNLKEYLDQTEPKPYSPTYHMEQVHEWNGDYSLWNQIATHPKTKEISSIHRHMLHNNAAANQMNRGIAVANNNAIAANTEADNYNQGLEARSPAIPDKSINKLLRAYNNITESTNPRRSHSSYIGYVGGSKKIDVNDALRGPIMRLGAASRAPISRMQDDFFSGILTRAERG